MNMRSTPDLTLLIFSKIHFSEDLLNAIFEYDGSNEFFWGTFQHLKSKILQM